jgi:hypothetical protein
MNCMDFWFVYSLQKTKLVGFGRAARTRLLSLINTQNEALRPPPPTPSQFRFSTVGTHPKHRGIHVTP